jgi:hypothetical protein
MGAPLRRPEKGLQVSDEPYVESKEIIVGFYLRRSFRLRARLLSWLD